MSPSRQRGFTLLELAVVTAIIGLLVAGAVTGVGAVRTNAKIKETNRSLAAVELLLRAYFAREGRLPCPAVPGLAPGSNDYGLQANTGGNFGAVSAGDGCDEDREVGGNGSGVGVYWGTLPTRTLGRSARDLTDGWGNQFYYLVSGNATLSDALTNQRWDVTPIELYDTAPANPPGAADLNNRVTDNGVLALISTGANGNGAFTTGGAQLAAPPATALAERDNLDADVQLTATNYSDSDTVPFDDVVRVLSEEDIILPLAENGSIDTKFAITRERMQRIVDAIFAFAANDQIGDPDGPAWSSAPGPDAHPSVCSPTGTAVPVGALIAYPCDVNTRNFTRLIPRSDSDPPTNLGVGDSFAEQAVPYADLGLAASEVQDAWGNDIRYDPDDSAAGNGPAAGAGIWSGDTTTADPTFRLTSWGPDGVAGGGDDLVVSFSLSEARGRLLRAGLAVD
ncbi:MAG: type II secretion system protein [Gammaproteobacteria bacterium]